MTWENSIQSVEVRRKDDGSITKITVASKRYRGRNNSYSCIKYEFIFGVNDGVARVRKIGSDQMNDLVSVMHTSKLFTTVSNAVENVPDVKHVEMLNETIEESVMKSENSEINE